jgi:predicted RNase H-like nuclease (RuvC/YqgF family)
MPRGRSTSLTIAQLERLLEERKATVVKLQKKRDGLQKKIDALDAQIAAAGGGGATPVKPPRAAALSRTAGGRVRNEMSLGDAIAAVVAGKGAMSVGDIMDAVTASGYRSGSKNFRGIVNQTLIKDERFQQASRGVYGMK